MSSLKMVARRGVVVEDFLQDCRSLHYISTLDSMSQLPNIIQWAPWVSRGPPTVAKLFMSGLWGTVVYCSDPLTVVTVVIDMFLQL